MKFNFDQFLIISILIPITFWTNISHANLQPYSSTSEFKCEIKNLDNNKLENLRLFRNPQNQLLFIEQISENFLSITNFLTL